MKKKLFLLLSGSVAMPATVILTATACSHKTKEEHQSTDKAKTSEDKYVATQVDKAMKVRAANNLGTLFGPFKNIVRGTFAINDGLFAARYNQLAGSDEIKKTVVKKFINDWTEALKKTLSIFGDQGDKYVKNGAATAAEYEAKKSEFLAGAKEILNTVVGVAPTLGIEGITSNDYKKWLEDVNLAKDLIKRNQNGTMVPTYSGENWVPTGASLNDLARFLESQTGVMPNPQDPTNDPNKTLPSGAWSVNLAKIADKTEFTKTAMQGIAILIQRMVTLFDGAITAAKINEGVYTTEEQIAWFTSLKSKTNMTERAAAVKKILETYKPYIEKITTELSKVFGENKDGSALIAKLKAKGDAANEKEKALLSKLESLESVIIGDKNIQSQFKLLIDNFTDETLNSLTSSLESYKTNYAKVGPSWMWSLEVMFRLNSLILGSTDLDKAINESSLEADSSKAEAVKTSVQAIGQEPGVRFIFNTKVRWITSLLQEMLAEKSIK